MKGLIVDINRFSLNDGPGIRTTLFLKGCPLRCRWCHNPESLEPKPQLSFNREKCRNCFKCVEACPSNAHKIIYNKHLIEFSNCELHNECVRVCPNEALSIKGEEKTVDEIMDIVLRDKDYYNNSGGGLTISGGEPMMQFEFTKQILKITKENSIHTCIETCGQSQTDKYLDILEYVDLFLYDFKETDPIKHKEYTGVTNRLILQNLSALYKAGANIILRCPLIPGINDSDEHLIGIVNIYKQFPALAGIEIMPYHNLGNDKAKNIGSEDKFIFLENTSDEKKSEWINKLNSFGCTAKLG